MHGAVVGHGRQCGSKYWTLKGAGFVQICGRLFRDISRLAKVLILTAD